MVDFAKEKLFYDAAKEIADGKIKRGTLVLKDRDVYIAGFREAMRIVDRAVGGINPFIMHKKGRLGLRRR